MSSTIVVSIVCYAGNERELDGTLTTLLDSCSQALLEGHLSAVKVILVDNGPARSEREKIDRLVQICSQRLVDGFSFTVLGEGENIGFGAGHNLAIDAVESDFHLVLNPDVELAPDSLSVALQFMQANPRCGVLAPLVVNASGEREYLCKRYPTVFDLFLRGFAPLQLRRKYVRRLAQYEMRDMTQMEVYWGPPIVSGCFMLLRSSLMQKLNGFDARYFLYFEDFDLSLRAAQHSRIAYVPTVRIVHTGGYAARKGWRHIWLFARSALVFFNRHGWRWY